MTADELIVALRAAPGRRILVAVRHGFPVPAGVQAVELPAKLFALLHWDAPSRYRVASGGRGSAKSWSFATALVLRMMAGKERILCCREIMRSLRESVHHLIPEIIESLGLSTFFEISIAVPRIIKASPAPFPNF
jgi:phage terminase large subunit